MSVVVFCSATLSFQARMIKLPKRSYFFGLLINVYIDR